MTRIRPIRMEEVPELRQRFKAKWPWAAEPNWAGVEVLERDGKITGFVGYQLRYLVEPLFAEDAFDTYTLLVHANASMKAAPEYEFFVADANKPFQDAIERHFGIEGHREVPGKIYQVRREVCHRKISESEEGRSIEPANATADQCGDAAGHRDAREAIQRDSALCANAD